MTRSVDHDAERKEGAGFHFDPTSPDALADPGKEYGRLASACPFYHLRTDDREWWITSDYKEIRDEILADNPVWSFKWGDAAKDTGYNTGIITDPPFHNEFRKLLLPGFTPRALAAFRPRIEEEANRLIDAMLARAAGVGDLLEDFAVPLPARVMCILLGLPVDEYRRYKHWGDALHNLLFHDTTPGSQKALFREISQHCLEHINHRRALLAGAGIDEPELHHLGDVLPDDYMSRSICSRIEGRRLTEMEIINICVSFITGGQETTTNLIGNMMWRLLEEPALWKAVKDDPGLVDVAVEESLRFDPPVLAHFRTSQAPTTMHGHEIPDHSKLMFSIAGVNRDPERFEDPERFRLDRPINKVRQHMSFGSGVHFCIGAPLGRMEGQIALRLFCERLPELRLIADGERIENWMYWGRKSLPVGWG